MNLVCFSQWSDANVSICANYSQIQPHQHSNLEFNFISWQQFWDSFLMFFTLFQDLNLWNKRPTKILIVHKQSHPMQRRELNTNFSTKELKQTKTDGMAWNYLGQILKEKYCYKVLPQSRWHVAVDSVVNWCHFELLSSFLEMRMPPSIPRYNQLESSMSSWIKKRKTRFCYQIVLQKHIKNLFMVQLRGDWGAKF